MRWSADQATFCSMNLTLLVQRLRRMCRFEAMSFSEPHVKRCRRPVLSLIDDPLAVSFVIKVDVIRVRTDIVPVEKKQLSVPSTDGEHSHTILRMNNACECCSLTRRHEPFVIDIELPGSLRNRLDFTHSELALRRTEHEVNPRLPAIHRPVRRLEAVGRLGAEGLTHARFPQATLHGDQVDSSG